MANGDIVRGVPGLPLYGNNGTILYKTNMSMSVNIVVSWSGGNDLDICAFYTHFPNMSVGWSHSTDIADGNGFSAHWNGDNTSGGPEYINLSYSGSNGLLGKSFEIHANWYSVGEGNSGSGGNATITATDATGKSVSCTIMPATQKHRAAQSGDPGVLIRFNYDGSIKDILAA